MEFRNYLYSPREIALNPGKFLDQDWVDVTLLREYLAADSTTDATTCSFAATDLIAVKIEGSLPPPIPGPGISVKSEPQVIELPRTTGDIKMRILSEGGKDIFELLSDSEPETSDIDEVLATLQNASRSSTAPPDVDDLSDGPHEGETSSPSSAMPPLIYVDDSDDDFDDDSELVESDTLWQDEITSFCRIGKHRLTQKVTVDRMDDEKYDLEHPKTKEPYTVDHLIRNADNDSWESSSGGNKSMAFVTFAPGEDPIKCRRARSKCKGAHACELIDPALRTAVRFELDQASRSAVIAAEADTRRDAGRGPLQNVALFMKLMRDGKCTAVDSKGKKCEGGPIMRAKSMGSTREHQYFIGCSGWTPAFNTKKHRALGIPDHVPENLLAKALAGQVLTEDPDEDTKPCSRLVHPHTGLKMKYCRMLSFLYLALGYTNTGVAHAHIVDGQQVRGRILNYPCSATRAIYIPFDTLIRKAVIVHNETGHNHPMPILSKVSFSVKEMYRQCIRLRGVLGATVAKVDNAQSTKLLLGGKTPTAFAPALYNGRAKRQILKEEKHLKYPNGTRYILFIVYIETADGGIIIITLVPALLMLLDDAGVITFDDDTTYKRILGEMNEWELTIFAKVVQRAVSAVRAYINRASTNFFEELFDELQRVKLLVTGKPIGLKKFVPGGNLLVMNTDMDGAQILGICRSVMKFNVPAYSGIPNDTPPAKIAPYFVKICWRHSKEPVHDFRSLVSAAEHTRLLDFVYIDSKGTLDAFSKFVYGLGIKKITDWWAHKEMHEWIIPCLVKSQSLISTDDWDSTPSTTNTNEAQHHYTNSRTGIKLSPLEALESAQVLDEQVAQDIKMSLRTGIISNPNNEVVNRMSRNVARQSATARKARESRELADESKQIQLQLEQEVERRRHERDVSGPSATPTQSPVVLPSTRQISDPSIVDFSYPQPAPAPWAAPTQSPSAFPSTSQISDPSIADFSYPQPLTEYFTYNHSTPNYRSGSDFDIASLGLSTLQFPQQPSAVPMESPPPAFDLSTFGGNTSFGLSSDFNALVPFHAPAIEYGYPVQDYTMSLFESYGFPSDFQATGGFFPSTAGAATLDPLPMLPPPPPESPAAPSPSIDGLPEMRPSTSRPRHVRKEVDEANILTSSRSRAPSDRKRIAEEAESTRAQKKPRSRKVWIG
ncbi:hypothetical protein DFH07DRAFT_934967 [Mycena maculata]|uniref:Uncharacterized protein n=1 Tax=Mycena maculata TaxID=230809 RepID=A0AAD7KGI5_9AGAR|nr:hypothetical protein DFH07DRAFT_934967 [Mycena maculata]